MVVGKWGEKLDLWVWGKVWSSDVMLMYDLGREGHWTGNQNSAPGFEKDILSVNWYVWDSGGKQEFEKLRQQKCPDIGPRV